MHASFTDPQPPRLTRGGRQQDLEIEGLTDAEWGAVEAALRQT